MNIWRTVRREATAAWRSLRYDLRGPSRDGAATEVIPQVVADAEEHPEYQAYARRQRRRVRTALAVAVLSVGGAAATYFGVVGGLSALLVDGAGPADALPGVTTERTPTGRLPAGAGSRASRPETELPSMRPPGTAPRGSTAPDDPAESRPLTPVPEPSRTTGEPPVPTPAPEPTPTCGCPQPTPTGTASPTPSPSPSPSDTPEPPVPPEWAVAPAS